MRNTERDELFRQLEEAKKKMETACQSGSKKAWRRYGKKVYSLQKQLNITIQPWMERAFGRSV